MTANKTQGLDMSVLSDESGKPDCALNAVLERSERIHGIDPVKELPRRHGLRSEDRLVHVLSRDKGGVS